MLVTPLNQKIVIYIDQRSLSKREVIGLITQRKARLHRGEAYVYYVRVDKLKQLYYYHYSLIHQKI